MSMIGSKVQITKIKGLMKIIPISHQSLQISTWVQFQHWSLLLLFAFFGIKHGGEGHQRVIPKGLLQQSLQETTHSPRPSRNVPHEGPKGRHVCEWQTVLHFKGVVKIWRGAQSTDFFQNVESTSGEPIKVLDLISRLLSTLQCHFRLRSGGKSNAEAARSVTQEKKLGFLLYFDEFQAVLFLFEEVPLN